MNMNQVLGEFVKFTRGTPASYAALPIKNSNTLYFISEPNATSGKLYLGNKLIAGSISGATSLADLIDVVISADIQSNSLLVYNNGCWSPKTIAEIFDMIHIDVMQGATEYTNGRAGLVPAPAAGDQDKFLRGDGSWAESQGDLTWQQISE